MADSLVETAHNQKKIWTTKVNFYGRGKFFDRARKIKKKFTICEALIISNFLGGWGANCAQDRNSFW